MLSGEQRYVFGFWRPGERVLAKAEKKLVYFWAKTLSLVAPASGTP